MAIISENETSTDAAAGIETTYTITGGDTFHGTLSDLDDVDYIKLDIDRGVEYEVHLTFHDLFREQFNVLGDLYVAGHLSVLDHQGNRLDFLGVSTSPDSPGLIFASNVMQAAGVVGLTGPSTTDIPVVIFNSGARGLSRFSDTMGDGWVQHSAHLIDRNLAQSDVDARLRFTALYDFNYHVSISWSFSSESTILPFDPMTYTLTVEIHDQLPATPLSEFEDIPFFESFSLATNATNSDSFITDGTLYGRFQTYFLGVYSMVLTGTGGDDFLRTLEGNDYIYALSGNDVLFGREGNDNLYGGPGNDLLAGGDGADTLDGGAGTDRLSYGSSDAAVTVNLADGTASGGHATGDTLTSIESLAGSRHHDVLTGNAGANRLTGGPGNDRLTGGGGADSLEGEVGTDTAVYAASAAAVIINLSDGTATGGDAQGDTLDSIENLIGSAHADTLTGNAGNNVLEGGGGADTLDGGEGIDTASYAGSATRVDVRLSGTVVNYGDATGDTLTNIENLVGSAHNDILVGNGQANALTGMVGNDLLWGSSGDDFLTGGPGADRLVGGAGLDAASWAGSSEAVTVRLHSLKAAGGDAQGDSFPYTVDVAYTDADGAEQTESLPDVENLIGSNHDDILAGDRRDNDIDGGAGNDTLYGGPGGGDDVMTGGLGNDRLFGGHGNDTLIGGPGDDSLAGGPGADVFVFGPGDGADTVTDFSGGTDKVDLTAFDIESIEAVTMSTGDEGVIVDLGDIGGGSILLADITTLPDAGDFVI